MRTRFATLLLAVSICSTTTSIALADGVLPDVATPVQREQAQQRFARGKELMAKKDYAGALTEFRASHEIVASPNTRLEISRCLRGAGNLVAAYVELGRTGVEAKELLAQDNRYQKAYDAATAERAEIEPKLGFVTLNVQNASDATTVTVGGEEIRRAAWGEPAPVAPGATEVVVSTPGHPPAKRTATLAAGQKSTLTIDAMAGEASAPPPPPEPEPVAQVDTGSSRASLRPWAYVAGGVGAAGLVTFGIFAVMAKSTYDDLDKACNGGPCPASKNGEISSGKTQQLVANVGLGVGIAGVALGATLFVLSMPKSTPGAGAALAVTPTGLRVDGYF
ncbi:MAG TPA: tetratricopeptide repeat protein [Polyangiaceae bacterium]